MTSFSVLRAMISVIGQSSPTSVAVQAKSAAHAAGRSSLTVARSCSSLPKNVLALNTDVIRSFLARAAIVWLPAVPVSWSTPSAGVVGNALAELSPDRNESVSPLEERIKESA